MHVVHEQNALSVDDCRPEGTVLLSQGPADIMEFGIIYTSGQVQGKDRHVSRSWKHERYIEDKKTAGGGWVRDYECWL